MMTGGLRIENFLQAFRAPPVPKRKAVPLGNSDPADRLRVDVFLLSVIGKRSFLSFLPVRDAGDIIRAEGAIICPNHLPSGGMVG